MFDNKNFIEWLNPRADEVIKKINQKEDLSLEEIMIGVLKTEEIYYRKRLAQRDETPARGYGQTI